MCCFSVSGRFLGAPNLKFWHKSHCVDLGYSFSVEKNLLNPVERNDISELGLSVWGWQNTLPWLLTFSKHLLDPLSPRKYANCCLFWPRTKCHPCSGHWKCRLVSASERIRGDDRCVFRSRARLLHFSSHQIHIQRLIQTLFKVQLNSDYTLTTGWF